MKRLFLLLFPFSFIALIICQTTDGKAQGIGINSSGNAPDPSSMMDVNSTSKGMLIPRMSTTERNAIPAPTQSLLIFNTTTKCLEYYVGTLWQAVNCGCNSTPSSPTAGIHIASPSQIVWNWNTVTGATGYKWSLSNVYSSATDAGVNTAYTQTNLIYTTAYTLYVWAYNACGNSAETALTQTTAAWGPSCGTQVWASANVNVGTKITSDGTHLQQQMTAPGGDQKYCLNNLEANCTTYGGLYEWGEAMNYAAGVNCDPCGPTTGHGGVQGICPTGYHIPSDLEWSRYEYCVEKTIAPVGSTSLATFQTVIGGRGSASTGVGPGDKLKESGTTHWVSGNTGTNTSGFAAVGSGLRNNNDGAFYYKDQYAFYWTSTENNASTAWRRYLSSSGAQIDRSNGDGKLIGMAVRCLLDQ